MNLWLHKEVLASKFKCLLLFSKYITKHMGSSEKRDSKSAVPRLNYPRFQWLDYTALTDTSRYSILLVCNVHIVQLWCQSLIMALPIGHAGYNAMCVPESPRLFMSANQ